MKEEYQIKNLCRMHQLEVAGSDFNCKTCKKKVINLYNSDIDQLHSEINKAKNSCVKIRPKQLNQINKLLSNSRRAILLSSAASLMSTSCNKHVIQNFGDEYGKVVLDKNATKQSNEQSNRIEGKLIDAYQGEPLMFAQIGISSHQFEIMTDIEGNFSFEMPQDVTDNQKIQFDYTGYYWLEIEVGKIRGKNIIVYLGEGPAIGYLELIGVKLPGDNTG